MDNNQKHVLWVEQNVMVTLDFQSEAKEFGLQLECFNCWDDAFRALEQDFDKWSAIILQPKSKLHPGSYANVNQFLPKAFSDINVTCALKGRNLPWYILTEIDEASIKDLILEDRNRYDHDWPKASYDSREEAERKALYKRIKQQTQQAERLQVRSGQYKRVFDALDYLENHKLSTDVRGLMEDMLVSLMFGSQTDANLGRSREVLEYLFSSMIANGLLPQSIKNASNDVSNGGCSRLLSGLDVTSVPNKTYKCVIPIMNPVMSRNIHELLNIGNSYKHAATNEKGRALKEYMQITGSEFLMHSCALQLCDIIIWYEQEIKDIEARGGAFQWWAEY